MERRDGKVYLTYQGETKSIAEWIADDRCVAKKKGTLLSRVTEFGMDDATALTMPVGQNVPDPHLLTYDGETKTITEWLADDRCVPDKRSTVISRVEKGWSDEDVLTRPVQAQRRSVDGITVWGETKTLRQWVEDDRVKKLGLNYKDLHNRLRRNDERADPLPNEYLFSIAKSVRITSALEAWGEVKTYEQWGADPRARVGASTIALRHRDGIAGEEAVSAPSQREVQKMSLAERFELSLRVRVAIGGAQMYKAIDLALLAEAGSAVKGEVQMTNRTPDGDHFCLSVWAEPRTAIDFIAELVHLTEAEQRFGRQAAPLRRMLRSSVRREQGTGDLYRFSGWFALDGEGEVWRQ